MAKRRRQASLRISWLARNSSNGIGRFLVQSPPGERKSGMPHSVEIPAPVNGAITRAAIHQFLQLVDGGLQIRRDHVCFPSSAVFRQAMRRGHTMRYLHTMLRVRNLDQALDFYCNKLGLKEARRRVDEKNRYTLVFLAAPEDETLVEESKRNGRDAPLVELTYNWDSEDYGEARYFGHLAYEVDDIYALCEKLMKAGVTINRPPRDGVMAFVRSPDKHSIELLQKGAPLPPEGAVGLDAEHREMVRPYPVCGCAEPASLPHGENGSICRRASSALRLAVQDAALSRRKHGFDSRRRATVALARANARWAEAIARSHS